MAATKHQTDRIAILIGLGTRNTGNSRYKEAGHLWSPPIAIACATSELTAPCLLISSLGTPSCFPLCRR
jgi:hypothetical protein